jgi:hypothetical protein
MLATLRYGLSDDERQKAAESLADSTWSTHPDVTTALTTGGREDPSASVRATCLRCIARINFNRLPQ